MREHENPYEAAERAAGVSAAPAPERHPDIPPRGSPRTVTPPSSPKSKPPPKLLLHQFYGQLATNKWKQNFCSCHDDGPDHLKLWTSVLVCPKTNQLFPSLPYDSEVTSREHNGVFWFQTKSAAEHAAAARALAWFKYQEWNDTGGEKTLEPIGSLVPSEKCNGYLSVDDLIHIPAMLLEKIDQQLLFLRSPNSS